MLKLNPPLVYMFCDKQNATISTEATGKPEPLRICTVLSHIWEAWPGKSYSGDIVPSGPRGAYLALGNCHEKTRSRHLSPLIFPIKLLNLVLVHISRKGLLSLRILAKLLLIVIDSLNYLSSKRQDSSGTNVQKKSWPIQFNFSQLLWGKIHW